ncbi:hypothetical protein CUR178_04868 [Leishmania enriettii]|uniref:Serine/threonine specific protein phosphatases domain-containing protein n=1 Tax=Leishmania enriettii TaxID=5663 RepID=A0A836GN32_LEIEN|nr:hypothetical protein CUR178_04868 [Leishmania enriettii]
MPQLTKDSPLAREVLCDPPLAPIAYKVSPLREYCRTGHSRVVVVPRHGGGAVVQWHRDSGKVRVVAGNAAMHASWVSAAHLRADSHSETVQLTILRSGLRAYIDGQRVTRIGSPVEVHATQRLSFGTDPTFYTAIPAPRNLIPRADPASTPRASVPPASSAVVGRDGQTSSSCAPLSSGRSPCVDFSLLPLCTGAEWKHGAVVPASTPPAVPSVSIKSARRRCQQDGKLRERTFASPLRCLKRTSELRGRSRSHAPRSIAIATNYTAEDVHALRQTTEKHAIDGPLTETPSELLVKGSAMVARCSAGVVDTAPGAALVPVYSEEERAGSAVCLPQPILAGEHANSLAHRCDELVERGRCRDNVPRSRTRLHNRPRWTLGPVTSVRSPDWEVLRAMDGDTTPPRPHDICHVNCGSVGFDDAMMTSSIGAAELPALSPRERGLRPQALRPHLQRPGAASPRVSHQCRGGFSPGVTEQISVDAEGGAKGTDAHATPLSGDNTVTLPSSVLSCHLNAAENAWERPYMREKMHLCPRITVNPFVVEAFGNTHRYRPLADGRGARHADSSCSSSTSRDGGAQVGVFDRFAGVPWQHPIAADEMITPRTEEVMRAVLQRHPDSTAAEEDAIFLHCALRRSYDADTDRFSYADSPAFVQLICTRFSSLLTAVKARVQECRPVLRLSSPVLCAGDLSGSFADLMVLLDSVTYFGHWSSIHTPLLLLGNYVDVGWHSVEVFMLLCCWAYLQPSKVHLLRGPHEDPAVNGNYRLLGRRCLRYKCRQRFGAQKGIALWEQLNDVFALLPVAAVIDERVFATHGGVPLLRASPSPGGKGVRDAARRRQCRDNAADKRLYTCTSGSPTPTSSDEYTSWPFSCREAAGVSSAERPTAARCESEDDDAMHKALFPAPYPFSAPYRRPLTPAMANVRDYATQEHAETENTQTGRQPPEPLSGDCANMSDVFLTACTEFSAPTAVVVAAAAPRAFETPPSDSTPIPHQQSTGFSLEGRDDDSAAVLPRTANSDSATPAPVSWVSGAEKANPIAAAKRSNPEKLARVTLVCEASSSSPHDGGGNLSLFEVLTDRCAPSAAAAAQSSLTPCSTASVRAIASKECSAAEPRAEISSPSVHALDEDEPSEDDFAALLAAMRTREYAFRTLQRSAAVESGDVTRRLRLVRELLWNRPREAASKRLMPEEGGGGGNGGGPAEVLWWRPHRVDGCCGGCPAGRAHRCCLIFGSGALIRFFLRFRFSLLIRGAPEDPSELFGAELSEEGRLLTLNTCRQRCKTALQAAACVVVSQTLRLATWGSEELADSLGQLSLSNLPAVQEAAAQRADFEQFVCNTLHARLRDHNIVGPGDQWSVLSAYKAYVQHRAAASSLL